MELNSARSDSETSEEFFDAEDTTPNRLSKKRLPLAVDAAEGFMFPREVDAFSAAVANRNNDNSNKSTHTTPAEDHNFVEPITFGKSGRQRFQELRQCMQNDDDENAGNTLTPDSQNSSVEGIFVNQKSSHPFRIIEKDAMSVQSMTSLGRVGRILAGSIDPSAISVHELPVAISAQNLSGSMSSDSSKTLTASKAQRNLMGDRQDDSDTISTSSQQGALPKQIILQEPDVIASTKLSHSKTTDSFISGPGSSSGGGGPIAPPRRKKKVRKVSSSSSEKFHISGEDFAAHSNEPSTSRNYYSMFTADTDDTESQTEEIFSPLSISRRDFMNQITSNDMPGGLMLSLRKGQSLGNSVTSINAVKHSPSKSTKSNSAPGASRRNSIDPSKGLNLFKAMQGRYVVQPQDEAANKAEGPSREELKMFREHITLHHEKSTRFPLSGVGSYSLGNEQRYTSNLRGPYKERRKSAGDEDILKQLNIYVRTRTGSGKQLSDFEILEQVPVKNLDTGEKIPLSAMKPPPPPDGWNPLSLHIHKLTSHLEANQKESDEESIGILPEVTVCDEEEGEIEEGGRLRKRTAKIKRFFGSTMRKTVDKAKSIASEVSHARHKEDVADIIDAVNPEQYIKIKASSTNKGPYEFTKLQHVQDLSGEHTGAVWCMKFSSCGRLLATAGQDRVLRIWVLKDAYPFFQDMRTKYNADQKSSPTPSQESLVSHNSAEEAIAMATAAEKSAGPFMPKAFCTYSGHTSDLLDVSWSKNYFILSSSMDKTVRLWHISRRECLCCFQHIDFVTAIAFHPRDDRYFLSGSLDGKLRLWNIPDKKVALWNEVDGQTKLITAANFCQNGKFAVVGSYDGRCIFYNTDQLKYHTQIHVRSTRGKNKTGRKISGIEPMPGEDKILVTSNDSRVRLYDLRDLNLSCKYKGYLNVSSQIKGSFSHDGKYIVAGSENQCIYIWKTNHDYSKLSSVRRDRSDFWEGIKAHNATVTCAIFAPHPEAIIKSDPDDEIKTDHTNVPDPLVEQRKKSCGYVLVSADFNGAIKVFINKTKPKHSSLPYTAILD